MGAPLFVVEPRSASVRMPGNTTTGEATISLRGVATCLTAALTEQRGPRGGSVRHGGKETLVAAAGPVRRERLSKLSMHPLRYWPSMVRIRPMPDGSLATWGPPTYEATTASAHLASLPGGRLKRTQTFDSTTRVGVRPRSLVKTEVTRKGW